jgi:hypothetical protein
MKNLPISQPIGFFKQSSSSKRLRANLLALVCLIALASMVAWSASSITFRSWLRSFSPPSEPASSVVTRNLVSAAPSLVQSAGGNLNTERRGHTATLLTDGKVIVVGGENASGFVIAAEVFDPSTGGFSISGNLSTPRADHTATRLSDGRVLIAGGRGELGPLSSTEIFDPASGTFSNGPDMNSTRCGQSATALSDGRIVFAGGDASGSVEIYDPQTNAFTSAAANLGTPRAFHGAARLNDGNVLIVGGTAPDSSPVLTGEVFNVADLTLSAVGNQTADPHVRALLRVLPDGKVQIIGGTDHEDMEIYDPAGNSFGAHAHVYPIGDSHPELLQEIMDAPTRTALFRPGASSALLNRTGHSITELPASNQALVVGGKNTSDAYLSSASVLQSSPASVTTDKLDYAPGATVVINGSGWQPNELVTLKLHEDPHVDTENSHTFAAQADAAGNFVTQQYTPEDQDNGVTYILAAKGGSSGLTAQTAFSDASPGSLGNYATLGLSGVTASVVPSNVAANVTFSNLTRGPGLTAVSAADAFNSSAWSTSSTFQSGSDDYYEFTITPNSCYRFSAAEVRIGLQTTATGPNKAELRSSLDSYGSTIGSVLGITTTLTTFTINLSSNPGLQNHSSAVTFRIYGYSASAATGTLRIQRVPSPAMIGLEVDGTVTSTPNSPPVVNSFTASTSTSPSAFAIDYTNASTGDTLELAATATDANTACGDSIASFEWTINGLSTSTATGLLSINWTTLQSTYGIVASGSGLTYALSVKAFDTLGENSSTVPGTLTVYKDLLVANLLVSAGACGTPSSFDGSASQNLDPRRSIVSYTFDFCDGTLAYTETSVSAPDGSFDGKTTHVYGHVGSYTAKVTAVDDHGKSGETTQSVNVTIDNVAPSITSTGGPHVINIGDNLQLNGTADDANLACGDVLTYQWDINNDGTFDYTGASGATTITAATLNALGVGGGLHTIKFRVTDTFSLSVSETTTLTIQTPPSIESNPQSLSDVCIGSSVTFSVTASGTSLTYHWRKGGAPLSNGGNISGANTASLIIDPIGTGDAGSYDVVVSGVVAPAATSSAATLGLDSVDPTITAPPDVAVNVDTGSCSATGVSLGTPATNDNCAVANVSNDAPTRFSIGMTTVAWTVTDTWGNTAIATQKVTVIDNIDPQISCPTNIAANVDAGSCTAIVNYTAPAGTDNCTGATTQQLAGLASGSAFPLGTTTNTFKVTDASGHTAECSFDVIVTDNLNPAISNGPGDITVNSNDANSLSCSQVVSWTEPTASDNCGGALNYFSRSHAPGSSFNQGTTAVTYAFRDAAGNESTYSFNVTVVDNTKPAVSNCPSDITVYSNGSEATSCSQTASWTEPTASDNCDGSLAYFSRNHAPGDTFPEGNTTISYVFKDAVGNESICSFKVTVIDNTPPRASCKSITRYLSNSAPGSVTVNASEINDGSTDDCTGSLTYQIKKADGSYGSSVTFACGETGNQAVLLKVTDAHGNFAECNTTVTVIDNTAPVAQAKAITTTFGMDGTVAVAPSDINNGSSDNCGITEYKIKKTSDPDTAYADSVLLACADGPSQNVTLRVKDAAGNTNTATSSVTLYNRLTTTTYSGPASAVYGGTVTLSAAIRDGSTNAPVAGRPVTFTIGTQSVNATTDALGLATTNLLLANSQGVGSYTVTAAFAGDCTFKPSSGSKPFTITSSCVIPPGEAQREYIGTYFAWTTSPTSSAATLTLSAALQACSGDIRTARVTFAIRSGSIWSQIAGATNLPVGLVDSGNITKGTATAIVQYNIGNADAMDLEIAIIVGGNYAQNDPSQDALITVAKSPATSSILGGGQTNNLADSRGFIRGANGDITQFFLNAIYNKKGSNPQGRVTIIMHSMNNPDGSPSATMRTYTIKSTAISVLAADTIKGTASFSSKATLQDITNPANPISIDGGSTLQIEMTDGAKGAGTNPAVGDTISIYLLNKNGGVWFANKLDSLLRAVQVPVLVGSGDIIVK